jgi:protocatechuate 3,4-dioxygenase beta subunit
MDDHDRPIGSLVSRRRLLRLFGIGAPALLLTAFARGPRAAEAGRISCVARPEQIEGPYFVDERLLRSDIRSDPASGEMRPGTPLRVSFNVSRIQANSCLPLAGAQVDVWHCDALGVYSDVRDPGFSTTGLKFLRGYQMTPASGRVEFLTIYPGWYQGRAVHMHFKIRTAGAGGRAHDFTSQLYFDDALTDGVHRSSPYARKGIARVRNEQDGLYARGGKELTLSPSATAAGYAAAFDIGLYLA